MIKGDTTALFAEWFVIGSSDHLITNAAHDFGVSAFSRSAWIYNLKSRYYEIRFSKPGNCKRKEFQYEGAVGTVNKVCRLPVSANETKLQQLPGWSKTL